MFLLRLPHWNGPVLSEAIDRVAMRRILLIDDYRDGANSLALMLETLGAHVRVAYSGAEGLEALSDFQPDVVLLDLGMPGMDGFETARRIRAVPGCQGVLLIALTGWSEQQIGERTRAVGFDHHLTKPASVETFSRLIASGSLG